MASAELFASLFASDKASNLLTLAKRQDPRLAIVSGESVEDYIERLSMYRGATEPILSAFWEAQNAGESLREVCKSFVAVKKATK